VLEERDFDGALKGIEDAADRVDETAPGSVQKKAKDDWRGWDGRCWGFFDHHFSVW
jgi:hypothetical protein